MLSSSRVFVPSAALSQPGYRYYALGCAATEGIDAALAAAAGIGADRDALDGYAQRIGVDLELAQLTSALGAPWLMGAVDTKLWPTSRQALASVAAFRELGLERESFRELQAITVHVPAAYREMVDRAAMPRTRIESMIGVQYQIALAAFAPETLYDAIRTELPAAPEIALLMAKVEVRADEALDACFPRQWGGRVTVRFHSGEERTKEVLDHDGAAARPLDLAGVERKYARVFAASKIGEPASFMMRA